MYCDQPHTLRTVRKTQQESHPSPLEVDSATVPAPMPARARRPSQKAREAAQVAAVEIKKKRPRSPPVAARSLSFKKQRGGAAQATRTTKKAQSGRDATIPPALHRELAKQVEDVVARMETRMRAMEHMAKQQVAADNRADQDEVRVLTAKQLALLMREFGKLSPDETGTALLYIPSATRDESSGDFKVDLTEMSDRARWRLWRYVMVAAPQARAEMLALLQDQREAEARQRVAGAQDFASNAYSRVYDGAAFKTQDGRTGTVFYDRTSKTLKVRFDCTGETWQLYTVNELRAGVLRARGVDVSSDSDSDFDLSSSDDG